LTTDEGYRAAAELMRGQADRWDAQAPKLASIVQQVGEMRFQRYDAGGLFKGVSEAHALVIAKVRDRCDEGHTVFQKISESLRILADRYQKMDQDQAAEIRASGGQSAMDRFLRQRPPSIMVDEPKPKQKRTR
jgi:hypothetical protein